LRILLSPSLRAKEAIEDVLDIIQLILLDIAANLEPISKHGRACMVHDPELLGQIRQVFHLRRLPGLLRPSGGTTRPAKHIAQDLAENVAARH
jgi:hypothetical protein